MGLTMCGMTFRFVDETWNLKSVPLCFMNNQELGKTALDHCSIIKAVTQSSDKLDEDLLVIGGTSENDASVSLGLDQF